MFPQQWTCPCGSQCTKKYAALMQIPWRVFCKKGCDADGDTFEECVAGCNEICYKDPVFKDQQWSAYIDRSPGSDNYSKECFQACISGCGYKVDFIVHENLGSFFYEPPGRKPSLEKFDVPSKTVDQVHPKRSPKPCREKKPSVPPSVENIPPVEEMACTSA